MHRLLTLAIALALTLVTSVPIAADAPVAEDEIGCEQVFEEGCPSHASGGRPELGPVMAGNPTDVVTVLRVGLRTTTFNPTTGAVITEQAAHDHADVRATGTVDDFHVIDLSTGRQVIAATAGQEVRVRFVGTAYEISLDGAVVGTATGPVRLRSSAPTNTFKVNSIRRSNWTSLTTRALGIPEYEGELEITRGTATGAGLVNLVNLVPLEPYVRGVVVNEGIATFHVEALKAQAAAARGYALSNKDSTTKFPGRPYGLDDTTSSQVYRGKGSEHPNGNAAVAATEALVATYDSRIIQALYSSSMGGFTENNEWIFNSPSSQLPGTNALPYLRGIYDGEGSAPDLSTEAGIAAFWSAQQPQTFDSCALPTPRVNNRFARWQIPVSGATLKTRVTGVNAGRIAMLSGNTSGFVTNVEIAQRMAASKRAGVVRMTFSTGVGEVRGWDNIRRVFGASQASQVQNCTADPPSTIGANFVLNDPSVITPQFDGTGAFTGIVSQGGGWGHNVGMSQFGAHGRGLAGQSFIQILHAYYTGTDIASYPIDIALKPGSGPRQMTQTFASPNGIGTLRIKPSDGLEGLSVNIGSCALRYDAAALSASMIETDVSACLKPGQNSAQYVPIGTRGKATVLVIVE
ncbi:MAG TPA: SpoIID/LytB domain-containing protein [Candidatus Limnocylindria bacterium]